MGWRQAAVVANLVIVEGPNQGLFVYNGTPALGDLVESIVSVAGTDRFGNAYLAGATNYFNAGGGVFLAVQTFDGAVGYYLSTAGPGGPYNLVTGQQMSQIGTNWFLSTSVNPLQGGAGTILNNAAAVVIPSGDLTGATDAANINAVFATAPVTVQLVAGQYKVNNTITVPSGCALVGPFPTQADNFSNYSAGTIQAQGAVITPVGAFTGQAVVACTNSTPGVQQGGQVLANFSIQANTTAAGSGSICILLNGAVGAGYLTGVTAIRGDAACLRIKSDSVTAHIPDQWTIENCTFVGSRSGHGVLADDMSDFNIVNCYSHDNALDGYNIRGGGNSDWTGCRAETNTGNGFHHIGFPAAGETMTFTGCTSELNKLSGFLFDATGFTNQGQYILTGCGSRGDGQAAAGILAGYYDNGSKSPIVMTGCAAITNATGPAYGAYEGSVAFGMALTGCRTQGITAATHDDGTNTHALSNLVPVPF